MKLELCFLHCFSFAVACECSRYEEILSESNFCAHLCFLHRQLKTHIGRPQICEVVCFSKRVCRPYDVQRLTKAVKSNLTQLNF